MNHRSENLAKARAARSSEKMESVTAALNRMLAEGTNITISSVSRAAGVSRSYLYSRQPRTMVEAASAQQKAAPQARTNSTRRVSKAEFDLVVDQNLSLKNQVQALRSALARKAGNEVEARELGGLSERIKTVNEENIALVLKLQSAQADRERYKSERDELSEELAASRALVQRMIRRSN